MPQFLSPICNDQLIDVNGDPLVGGQIETYLAGSTTPAQTYTDDSGSVPQSNPIILNSLGYAPNPIWLTGGVFYKFVIKNAAGVIQRTVDDIAGVNDASVSQSEWVDSGLVPTYINPTSFSVPGDQTTVLQIGRRVRTTNTTGLVYSTISNSVFAAGITTVTLTNDSTTLDPGLSGVAYALLAASPLSVPNLPGSKITGSITASGLTMNTARVLGRVTSGVGALEELTAEQLSAFVLSSNSLGGSGNRFINGSLQVDQRNFGVAQTITAAAALAYTVDRWYAYCTGANVTGQRVTGTAPNRFNYRFTGAASVTKIGFAQRIEAANCQDLAGQTATLSVDLANSLLTTVTWTAWRANTEDSFGTLASPTRTQIATGTFTVTSTLTRYSAQIAVPAAATTGIEVEFSVGAQVSGTWTIGRVQLERGAVASPFEYRSIGQELMLCQRYLPAFKADLANDVICPIAVQTSTTGYALFPLYVEPRVAPTGATISNITQFSAFNTAGGVTALTGLSFSSASRKQVSLFCTVGAASFTAGGGSFLSANSTSAQMLFTGCEL